MVSPFGLRLNHFGRRQHCSRKGPGRSTVTTQHSVNNSGQFNALVPLLRAMARLKRYVDLRSETTVALGRWGQSAQLRFLHALAVSETEGEKAGRDAMTQVLAIQPTNPNALNYIAYSLATENLDLNQAEILIRRALRLKSGDAAMIDTLGWVLYRQGRLKRAYAHIHRAVLLSPSNGEIRLHLACPR